MKPEKMSEEGLAMLLGFEGMVAHVYKDVAGIETVCVGHVVQPGDENWISDGVTKEECRQVLGRDVARFETAINQLVKVKLSQPMYDALGLLVFNIGIGAFSKSTVLKELNAGRYSAAADAFTMWRYAKVRQKDGTYQKRPVLLSRREAEAALFRSGTLEALGAGWSEPKPVDALLAQATAKLFDLRFILDDRGLPLPDNDETSEDGRLVCLPPEDEEQAA